MAEQMMVEQEVTYKDSTQNVPHYTAYLDPNIPAHQYQKWS